MSRTPESCSSCALIAVTVIGTSCRFCSRFCAVTVTVDSSAASSFESCSADCAKTPHEKRRLVANDPSNRSMQYRVHQHIRDDNDYTTKNTLDSAVRNPVEMHGEARDANA